VEKTPPEKLKSNKLTFKEKRELEELETQIPETEARLAEIDRELVRFATDAYKLNELVLEQQKLNAQLEQSIERWAELAERADL
jgi:ATP-binding cassette subfamily F protein uup